MQVISSFSVFLLLILSSEQYNGVQAYSRIKRQPPPGEQIAEIRRDFLESEGFETTTENDLLDDIDDALEKKREYELEIQQQQEKLRKLQEQYEYELQQQQKKRQERQRLKQYELRREQPKLTLKLQEPTRQKLSLTLQEPKQQLLQRQELSPNAQFDYLENAAESDFYEHYNDGTYAYGYALPNGVRRYEHSYFHDELEGMLVEGFYAELRDRGTRLEYEIHCYRAGPYGYQPMPVRFLDHAPLVRPNMTLDNDCFDN